MNSEFKVVVVGAGAIGSHLLRLLVRIGPVRAITIIDKDVYDDSNLGSQDITPHDVGYAKAHVQARVLSRLRPEIRTTTVIEDIKYVPLGMLRGSVICSCLDSRLARLYVNQCAFRLGVPFVNAGVHTDDLLARTHVYGSRPDAACLECAWDDRDYKALELEYPCANANRTFRTNAPVGLGALAASMQALEVQKLIMGQHGYVAEGRQVLLDAKWHKHRVTEFKRNAECRFDHQTWPIQRLERCSRDVTLGQAFALAQDTASASEELNLRVERRAFITKLTCDGCAQTRNVLQLDRTSKPRRCSRCGGQMKVAPFGVDDRVQRTALSAKTLARSLHDIGLQAGDVYTVFGSSRDRHFEIPCEENRRTK